LINARAVAQQSIIKLKQVMRIFSNSSCHPGKEVSSGKCRCIFISANSSTLLSHQKSDFSRKEKKTFF